MMPPKKGSIALVVFLLIALCAWSPWLTEASAKARTVAVFTDAWAFIPDGCGLYCKGCGAISTRRVPFGVLVTLDYACGLIPADLPEYHRQSTAFVSAFGSVHGLPTP
jgi:hypothetical protein